MKKSIAGILTAALVLTIGATSAFATAAGNGQPLAGTASDGDIPAGSRSFVDANGDGVCDNFGTSRGFVDANGDGVCDNFGTYRGCGKSGRGKNFTDANGDGICDNYAGGCPGRRGNGLKGQAL